MRKPKCNWLLVAVMSALFFSEAAITMELPSHVLAISQAANNLLTGTSARPGATPQVNDVADISQQWSRQWSARQLDGTLALYTSDAVFFTGEGTSVVGQSAIRALFQHWLDISTATIELHSLHSESSGDMAYDSGDYTETIILTKPMGSITAGTKTDYHGCYLMALKRMPDGKWRIAQHMWTSAPPESK